MDPQTITPPPEARLIRAAREAAGMTAADAARAVNEAAAARGMRQVLSPAYWRDIERGYGGRRGVRVPVRASARVFAHMAASLGLTPERIAEEGRREDAAEILREIRSDPPPSRPAPDDWADEDSARASFERWWASQLMQADAGDLPALRLYRLLALDDSEHPIEHPPADWRDLKTLMLIGRTRDPEGQPYSWQRKYETAARYLAAFDTGAQQGNAGTA